MPTGEFPAGAAKRLRAVLLGCALLSSACGARQPAEPAQPVLSASARQARLEQEFAAEVTQRTPAGAQLYYAPIRITEGEGEEFSYAYQQGFRLGAASVAEGALGRQSGEPIAHVPGEIVAPMDATLYFVPYIDYPLPVGVRAAGAAKLAGAKPAPQAGER